jgi:hypothetical protein
VKALVVGFGPDDTRRLSQELREAGHHVLGALGKQGAWTFLRATTLDVVVVPTGPDGERARGWVSELGVEVAFVEVPRGSDAAKRIGRGVAHARSPSRTPTQKPTAQRSSRGYRANHRAARVGLDRALEPGGICVTLVARLSCKALVAWPLLRGRLLRGAVGPPLRSTG